jgi:hypothetical protein
MGGMFPSLNANGPEGGTSEAYLMMAAAEPAAKAKIDQPDTANSNRLSIFIGKLLE